MVITKAGFTNKCFLVNDGLLVKINFKGDIWVLVKHVSDFTIFVK